MKPITNYDIICILQDYSISWIFCLEGISKIKVHLVMFIFLDFDKWIQQCFHLHNTSQNSSLTRKYPLCMPFMVSTLGPPISGNHRYLCLYCFVFSRWSNIWNPTIFSLWGSSFFHLAKCIYFHPCCCMNQQHVPFL